MLEKLSGNILNEATRLVRSQAKEDAGKYNMSFEELFSTDSNSDYQLADNYEDIEIEITIDKKEENKSEENNDDFASNVSLEYVENKEKNKTEIKKKILKVNSEEVSKRKNIQDDKTPNTFNEVNGKKQVVKLNFKDLDVETKQKIKNLIMALRAGKIDENVANANIALIIKSASLKNFVVLDKGVLVNAKLLSKKDRSKSLLGIKKKSGENKIESKSENRFEQITKNDKNPISELETYKEKEVQKKDIKKNVAYKIKTNEKNDNRDSDNIKFEINIENKTFDSDFNKKPVELKRVLEENKQNIFKQIVKNTKIVLNQQQTKFSTMIRPEKFGRIDLRFVVKDGKVNGRMILQNQETADFFRSNIEEIRAVFQKSNVELENMDIILAGNKFNNTGEGRNEEFMNSESAFVKKGGSGKKEFVFEESNFLNNNNYSKREFTKVSLII